QPALPACRVVRTGMMAASLSHVWGQTLHARTPGAAVSRQPIDRAVETGERLLADGSYSVLLDHLRLLCDVYLDKLHGGAAMAHQLGPVRRELQPTAGPRNVPIRIGKASHPPRSNVDQTDAADFTGNGPNLQGQLFALWRQGDVHLHILAI